MLIQIINPLKHIDLEKVDALAWGVLLEVSLRVTSMLPKGILAEQPGSSRSLHQFWRESSLSSFPFPVSLPGSSHAVFTAHTWADLLCSAALSGRWFPCPILMKQPQLEVNYKIRISPITGVKQTLPVCCQ